ncbi:MAG: hypothetical protein IPL28_20590 [Chloroflexi bacterium]|nr:hypothetical protein [Chloroflexota bacterium]
MSDKDKDKKGSFGAGADKLRGAVEKAKEEAQKRQQQQKLDELRKKQAARGSNRLRHPVGRRPPPAQRPHPLVAATAAAASALSDDQKSKLNSLRSSFDSVNQDAELGDLYREIGEIDNQLTNLPLTLDTLRGRGFVHSGNLEKALDKLDEEGTRFGRNSRRGYRGSRPFEHRSGCARTAVQPTRAKTHGRAPHPSGSGD